MQTKLLESGPGLVLRFPRYFAALLLAATVLFAGDPGRVDIRLTTTDLDGHPVRPFDTAGKRASILFFVAHDCPISNSYSLEIGRICEKYSGKAVCSLVYGQPDLAPADAKKHFAEFGHHGYPAIIDRQNQLSKATGVTITPEAVVVRADGVIAYRGRIDNMYASPGRRRANVTEFDLRDAIEAVLAGHEAAPPRGPSVGCYIPPPMSEFSKAK